MSEGPEQDPKVPEMTQARAIALAFRWALVFVAATCFLPIWRIGGGSMVQLVMPVVLTLLAASLVHRSWKVVLWIIPISCVLLILLWFLLLMLFTIGSGHPG